MWTYLEACIYVSTIFVFVYGAFCFYVSALNVWCVGRRKLKKKIHPAASADLDVERGNNDSLWPPITIQIFISKEDSKQESERRLFEQLLRRLGNLDYPIQKLQIQLLEEVESETDDDDFDVLSTLASHAPLQSFSHVLTIPWSFGQSKDEVLKEALSSAKGDYVFVLESSSIPEVNFLKECLKIFAKNEKIGVVQPLFRFLNSEESFLTRFQCILNNFNSFDSHEVLKLEGDARRFVPSSLNEVCGFVGVWKNVCIDEISNSLSQFTGVELAHRAQLKGWKVHSHSTLKLEVNFPNSMQKYKSEQYHIAKDATRCFRKFFFAVFQKSSTFRQKLMQLSQLARPLLFVPFFIILTAPIWEALTNSAVRHARLNYAALGLGFAGMFARLLLSQIMTAEELSWRSRLKNVLLLPFAAIFAVGTIVNTFRGVLAGLLVVPAAVAAMSQRLAVIRAKSIGFNLVGRIFRSKTETLLFTCFFCLLYFGNASRAKYDLWNFLPINGGAFVFFSVEALRLYLFYSHCFFSSIGLLFVIYWSLDSHIPHVTTPSRNFSLRPSASFSSLATSHSTTAAKWGSVWNQVNFVRVLFACVGVSLSAVYGGALLSAGR
eukprot:TRINITY_DN7177_c0_g1_i1.p1 TRINITY_DN7177_c0_g1~~TRINITY_DN7177_c0_g1_i1.p1  ORF type:complete len:605 (-),score=138.82 TRINITY_DN7177_c0_g1_i1:1154-2968(-)